MEVSNQPMMIGLLSPAFEIDGPYTFKSLNFVSAFYIGSEDSPKSLELNFEYQGCSGEVVDNPGPFFRTISHDDSTGELENLAIISFPLDGLTVDIGAKVKAILKYEDIVENYSVSFAQAGLD